MNTVGNINDKTKGVFDDNGAMRTTSLSGGVKASGNVNDLEHGSIIESAGTYLKVTIS